MLTFSHKFLLCYVAIGITADLNIKNIYRLTIKTKEMAKVCEVTGKRTKSGNNVSHANNRTRRKFFPNLHSHRIWVESQNKYVKLRLSKKGLRTIDKLGIGHVLDNLKDFGEKV